MIAKNKNFKTVDKKTLLKEVFKTLQYIFVDGTFMDKAMEKTMRNNKRWKVRKICICSHYFSRPCLNFKFD